MTTTHTNPASTTTQDLPNAIVQSLPKTQYKICLRWQHIQGCLSWQHMQSLLHNIIKPT